MADLEFVADFTDLQLMRRELVGVAKDAKQSAGVFEREYNKVERQITRTAKASQQHYNELLKVDRASKSAANSADVFTRELGKQEANIERLKNKYVPLYAASKQYERSLDELKAAHQQGILTAAQYDTALENLNSQFAVMNTRAIGNTRSMNAMGMATQQVGYQVGDFLVQVQGGTNWMVAFGQQATQLVGVLPMMAEQFNMNVNRLIGIASVLGIVIPLVTAIGAAIMRTRGQAKEAEEAFKDLKGSLDRLEAVRLDAFGSRFAEYAKEAREEFQTILGVIEQVETKELERKLLEPFRSVAAEIDSFDFKNRISGQLGEIDFDSAFGIETRNQAIFLATQLQTLDGKTKEELQGQLEAITSALSLRGLMTDEVQEMLVKLASEISLVEDINKGLEDKVKSLEESNTLAESFKSIMESITIDNLLSQMDSLNSKLGSAIFGAGTMSARLRGLFDDGVELAERAKIQQDQQRARQEGFRFESTKTEGGISKTEAFFSGNVGFSNIPEDIDNPMGLPGKKTSGSKKQTPGEKADDYLRKLELEVKYKESIIGLSEREARVQEIIKELKQKELPIDEKRIQNLVDMEEKVRKLTEAEQQREQMMDMIESNIQNAFMSIVDGSKSVEDAFRSMLRNIILAVYQQQVAQPAATAIGNLAGKIFNFDGGGFTGYGSRSGGLDGKGGMMAMVHPNETVIDHTKGQSMGSVQVVNNFNISANGDESVKRIIRGEVPRITEATKAAVVDAKRRGGSYGRSF